jgi:hypothetical protein
MWRITDLIVLTKPNSLLCYSFQRRYLLLVEEEEELGEFCMSFSWSPRSFRIQGNGLASEVWSTVNSQIHSEKSLTCQMLTERAERTD